MVEGGSCGGDASPVFFVWSEDIDKSDVDETIDDAAEDEPTDLWSFAAWWPRFVWVTFFCVDEDDDKEEDTPDWLFDLDFGDPVDFNVCCWALDDDADDEAGVGVDEADDVTCGNDSNVYGSLFRSRQYFSNLK